ncbi:MAG: hypothetical protein AAF804_02730 [Bacteroidota bacterium]
MKFSLPLLVFSLLLTLGLAPLRAQDAKEGNFTYMKKETVPGVSIVIMGQPSNVEDVVKAAFKENAKARARSQKGMTYFEETRFSPISSEEYDYYFTFEKPSRKDDDHTQINLFLKDQDQGFVTSVAHPRTIANAKNWLADLELETKVYEMNLVIEDQRKLLERTVQAEHDLISDSTKLQRDLSNLQEDISDNKQNLADQRELIKEEQDKLESFELKMKGLREERDVLKEARRRVLRTTNGEAGNN